MKAALLDAFTERDLEVWALKEQRRNATSFSASVLPRSFTRRLRSYRVPRMPERLRFKSIRPLRIRMDGSRSNFEGALGLYCRAWCNGFGESLPAAELEVPSYPIAGLAG
jgi:hypothetical protein